MKLAILGLVAVLLLGGGAAGAYFYLAKPAEAAAGAQDEAAKAEHEAKEKAAKDNAEGAAGAEFVQMDPLILPIIDETGVSQTIAIVISIEVPHTAAAEQVKHLMPRLKDAYIQDMYGTLSRKTALENGVLQVGMIKERLNKVSDKVVGEENVSEVLLQVVHQNAL